MYCSKLPAVLYRSTYVMSQQHDGNVKAVWQLFKRELETKLEQYCNLKKES